MDERSDERKDERMTEKVVVQKNELKECVSKSITICIYLVVDNALHPNPLTLRDFS